MNIERATIRTATPEKTAYLFSAVLAADKGYTSTVRADGDDWIVTASDGQSVRFAPITDPFAPGYVNSLTKEVTLGRIPGMPAPITTASPERIKEMLK